MQILHIQFKFYRHKQKMLLFLFLSFFFTRKLEVDSTMNRFNTWLNPVLKKIIGTRCFSKIYINLNQPCTDLALMKKCSYQSCVVPRMDEKHVIEICKKGMQKGNVCIFTAEKEEGAIGVDLMIAEQINSGYKKGAAAIWVKMYEIAEPDHLLSSLISGIHYSIMIHIARFYSKKSNGYHSNAMLYNRKRNDLHFSNLVKVYRFVEAAISKLEIDQIRCSLDLSRNTKFRISNLISTLRFGVRKVERPKAEYRHLMDKIIRLLNCIDCDKCKLWGKIQFMGLNTALAINSGEKDFLTGDELIYLFNLFYKLSSSLLLVNELEPMIKYRHIHYLNLYSIEITTVIICLILFYLATKIRRKGSIKSI